MAFNRFPNIFIKHDNFAEDVKALIREIRPNWDTNDLKIKKFHGGVSNLLFGVYLDAIFTNTTDMILVRIYGEILLDRDLEMENMAYLSKYNLAASVWGKFANGCAYQYTHGTPLELPQVQDDQCIPLIINEMVKLHSLKLDLDRPVEPIVFRKIKEMAHFLPEKLKDPEQNEIYLSNFPSKSEIFQEIECLEKHLINANYPITFCHNDLLVNNMIMNLSKDRIHFIDFEYADYNYCGFDIGNHFNEFAGLEYPDFTRYPNEAFQKRWISQYLQARHLEINGCPHNGLKSDLNDEIDFWYKMVNKFSLASNLLWSIWSIWQYENSVIEFDYLKYGIIRWNAYKTKKDQFLSL